MFIINSSLLDFSDEEGTEANWAAEQLGKLDCCSEASLEVEGSPKEEETDGKLAPITESW